MDDEALRPAVLHARLVHTAPGRVRLRIPALRRATRSLTELASTLEKIEGVGNVHPNEMTGSLLIEGMRMSLEQLQQIAQRAAHVQISRESAEPTDAALIAWERTSMRALERGAPLALLGLAIVQATRGQLLPPALSLALYALDHLRARHADAPKQPAPLGP